MSAIRVRQAGMSRGRRGFTLTEVSAAMLVVGFAVAMFGAAFPACGQTISRGRHTDTATNACQQQLDFWRQVGYASLPAIADGRSAVQQSLTAPTALPNATGSLTFSRVGEDFAAATSETGRVRVDVSITWRGTGSDRGTVSLTSLLLR